MRPSPSSGAEGRLRDTGAAERLTNTSCPELPRDPFGSCSIHTSVTEAPPSSRFRSSSVGGACCSLVPTSCRFPIVCALPFCLPFDARVAPWGRLPPATGTPPHGTPDDVSGIHRHASSRHLRSAMPPHGISPFRSDMPPHGIPPFASSRRLSVLRRASSRHLSVRRPRDSVTCAAAFRPPARATSGASAPTASPRLAQVHLRHLHIFCSTPTSTSSPEPLSRWCVVHCRDWESAPSIIRRVARSYHMVAELV